MQYFATRSFRAYSAILVLYQRREAHRLWGGYPDSCRDFGICFCTPNFHVKIFGMGTVLSVPSSGCTKGRTTPVILRRFFNGATLRAMQVDAPMFSDGLSLGFFMGFLASLLMCGLFFGFWLALRPNSASQQEVKSRAASASS